MLIIPTYNERDNIATLVSRIRTAVGDEPIFFVDDNSPDGTADEIRRIQQQDPNVHLMARPGKGGYGSACRDAMKKILEENLADYVIQCDADLSHPPELLPRMLEMLRTKTCQVVIGSRYVKWRRRQELEPLPAHPELRRQPLRAPLHRSAGARHDRRIRRLPHRGPAQDRSRPHPLRGYAFLMEMKFTLHRSGTSFCEFPIIFNEREAGHSKFSRKILYEGMRFPLKALGKRLSGAR